MPTTTEFLEYLAGNGKYHITNRHKVYVNYYPHNTDMYFVCGTATPRGSGKGGRVDDNDIITKKYFAIDIDIRKTLYEKTGEIITQQHLTYLGSQILNTFDNLHSHHLSQYSAVVCSGNGFHIYYTIIEKHYDKQLYKLGVSAMYDAAHQCLQESDSVELQQLEIDYSTSNISRLFRLPGTTNTKASTEFKLEKTMCEIVCWKPFTTSFIDLENLGKARRIVEQSKKYVFTRSVVNQSASFDTIQTIPTHLLFTGHVGIPIHTDGRNFLSPKDQKYIGCFYDDKSNLIVNTGTHYIKSGMKAYGPRSYVKHEILNTKDNRQVYQWFKDNKYING